MVDAGYYPRQVDEKRTMSKHDRRENKQSRAMRRWLGKEESGKTIRTDKLWKQLSRTSEANSIALLKAWSPQTMISKNLTRKGMSYNKHIIESNR